MQDLFFDHAFWIALIQIVGIDIVLSGDNAVVIALAARGLDPEQRKKAVMWGSSAAVAMRVTLTVLAAELLQLPLLKAGGALLLLWIAIQLLVPEDEGEGDGVAVAKGSMIAAIKTIKKHMIHVHISENDRGTPGKGHVPWAATYKALRAAKYDGWLTIEAFGRAIPALAAATRVWRDFFPNKEEVYRSGYRNMKQGWAKAGK